MALIDLCRLCITSTTNNGIFVYPGDFRFDKIRDCLSIIIADNFQICPNCDEKLNQFYQFRIDSVRAQHEFADILKSMQYQQQQQQHHQQLPIHNSHYESEYSFVPIRELEQDQNIYSNVYSEPHETYGSHQLHFDTQLHLALDDDNQGEEQSTIYQPIHTPISPATTPTIIPHSNHHHHHIEQPSQQQQTAVEVSNYEEPQLITNEYPEETPNPPDDDFTYDDDESCHSFPNDRNNVEHAIDKKIEEFIQNKRNKGNPKICTVCNKLFRTNYKLREHMQTHAENNAKYLCDFENCNKAFRSKIGLKEHAARHRGEFNFSCVNCDKKFLLRSYYLAHQKTHSNVKSFSCSMCSRTFKTKQNLINHENFHYGLKHFTCPRPSCLKQFTTKSNLDNHMKTTHMQGEQFECQDCHKFFKTKGYLNVHRKTHYKELQNHACEVCKKTFIQLSDLKTHLKVHTKEKSFVCEVCGDAFSRKDSLKLHALSHDKVKLFICACKKSFTRRYALNKHRKKCNVKEEEIS